MIELGLTCPRPSFGGQVGDFSFWSTPVTPLIHVWQAQAVSSHDAHQAANQAQLRLLQEDLIQKGILTAAPPLDLCARNA